MAYWNNKTWKDSITLIHKEKNRKERFYTFNGKLNFLTYIFDEHFKSVRWIRNGKILGQSATYKGV